MPYSVGITNGPTTSYKQVLHCFAGVSGSWKRILGRWVGVNGVWKLKYSAGALFFAGPTVRGFAMAPDVPEARITFSPDGTLTAAYTDQTVFVSEELAPWYAPKAAAIGANFEIRALLASGVAADVAGPALGAWHTLNVNREWSVTTNDPNTNNRTKAVTLRLEIRAVGATEPEVVGTTSLSALQYNPSSNGGTGAGGGVDRGPILYIQN